MPCLKRIEDERTALRSACGGSPLMQRFSGGPSRLGRNCRKRFKNRLVFVAGV
jgi:hypothetical protein